MAEPRKPLKINPTAIARAAVAEKAPSPFKIPAALPGVVPKDRKLAADSAMTAPYEFASMGDAWAEGQAFLGYPTLAAMSQRAEYRRPVEILAQEMTRKWIKLQSTGSGDEQAPQPGEEDGPPSEPPQPGQPKPGHAPVQAQDFAPGVPHETPAPGAQPEQDKQDAAATLEEEEGQRDEKAEKIRAIEAELIRIGAQQAFKAALEHDGFFGRGQIYIQIGDDDDMDPDEVKLPLFESADKIIKGTKLGKLRTIEPYWTYPNSYNSVNPLKADFFVPETWYVLGKEVHRSRLLTVVTRPVPDILKPAYVFGGLPLAQMLKPYVDNWLGTRQSVSDLIESFTCWVLQTDMSSVLVDGGDGGSIFDRVDLFSKTRTNRGVMVVDKDREMLTNVSAPISGLDHLQAQAQEHMAGCAGIPLVKLFGISPSGLNASSEGEISTFYDSIEAMQEAALRPLIKKVINIVQLSLFGEIDEEIDFKFNAMLTMDDSQIATIRKTDADRDVALINAGIIDPIEARTRLANDEDSPFAALDLSKEIDPPQPEMPPGMGGNPFGGEPGEPGEPGPGAGPSLQDHQQPPGQ